MDYLAFYLVIPAVSLLLLASFLSSRKPKHRYATDREMVDWWNHNLDQQSYSRQLSLWEEQMREVIK